jgi:hypothetical protein
MNDTPLGPSWAMDFEEANSASYSTFGSTPLHGAMLSCEVAQKKAMEVSVVDSAGRLLGNHLVELSDGAVVYRLRTTAFGAVRFEGLDKPAYHLSLVSADMLAWESAGGQALAAERTGSTLPAAWGPPEPVNLAGALYQVQPGEGLDKIALRMGHLPETVWDDANNRHLHASRPGRNVLAPGDTLYIPPRRPVSVEARAGGHYTLRFKGGVSRLRLRLELGLTPQDGVPYLLEVPDMPTVPDTTKDGGYIDTSIPTTTTRVTLVLDGGKVRIELPIDTLLPLNDDRGVQQRLRNLGFPCAATDGTFDDAARAVLHRFQDACSLPRSDVIDDKVRRALFGLHDRA